MKIKTNFKIMIALVIMLLVALVFNINTVKATKIDLEDTTKTYTYNNLLYYSMNVDGEIFINGPVDRNLTQIVIPDEIDGREVIGIGQASFKDCKNLISVKLGKNIKDISMESFQNCTSLVNIDINNKVCTIMSNAFKGCISLKEIEIPDSVTYITSDNYENTKGTFAFSDCSKDLELIVTKGLYAENYAKENGIKYKYNNKKELYDSIVSKFPDTITINHSKNETIEEKIKELIVVPEEYQVKINGNSNAGEMCIGIYVGIMLNDLKSYTMTNYYAQTLSNKYIRIINTTDTIEKILAKIPDSMNLNIQEIEYEKSNEQIRKNIEQILKNEKIEYEEFDNKIVLNEKLNNNDIAISCIGTVLNLGNNNFHKGYADIYYFNKETNTYYGNITNKDIQLVYNNTQNYNKADEQYIKNLKLTSPKYYEVGLEFLSKAGENAWTEFFNVAEQYYTNQINDKSITVKADAGPGDGGLNIITGEGGTFIGLFKNGILYDIRIMGSERSVPVINVPKSVLESEVNTYVSETLNKYKPTNSTKIIVKSIEKGTKNLYKLGIDIVDGYTINYEIQNSADEAYIDEAAIIIRNEKTVETTDTKTNIKLDTDTTVVPSNTILVAEEIKEEATIKAVKESLENIAEKFVTYDITLTSNGVAIQPNGKVKISIPVPSGFDTSKIAVYRIEADGTKVEYEVTIENGYIVFETDHFSNYVVAEKTTQVAENTDTTNSKELDVTPKTGIDNNTTTIISSIVSVICVLGIAIIKKF